MSTATDNCILCKIVSGAEKDHIVWSNNDYITVLDLRPMAAGHLLLVPKIHTPYLFVMEDVPYTDLLLIAKKLAEPLRATMMSKRIGLAVEGVTIDHVHLHLVPVNHGNDLDPNKAHAVSEPELIATATKLRQAFISIQ